MGMYTEIYLNVNLKKETSVETVNELVAHIKGEREGRPLCADMSYYTPSTSAFYSGKDSISGQWSLLCKGDLKNYDKEIEKFVELLKPHVDLNSNGKTFIGYMRYEESIIPTLLYAGEEKESI